MARKGMLLLIGGYLATLGVLALSLHNASPGPAAQEILGIGIGRHDQAEGIVYLSGCSVSDRKINLWEQPPAGLS